MIAELAPAFGGALHYLFEPRQGKATALNTGILASSGDMVGLLDDDEQVGSHWFATVASAFETPGLAFIGGPCLPMWEGERPAWLPPDFRGVIGWVDGGRTSRIYGEPDFNAMLMGGNAVARRAVFENVGLYDVSLGARTGTGMLTSEDEDMYHRIIAAGWRGAYLPNLIIHHHVSEARLTKAYHRRWCFWQGVSLSLLDRKRPARCPRILGIPRWYWGLAANGCAVRLKELLKPDSAAGFTGELHFVRLLGLLHGRHFFRSAMPSERTGTNAGAAS